MLFQQIFWPGVNEGSVDIDVVLFTNVNDEGKPVPG